MLTQYFLLFAFIKVYLVTQIYQIEKQFKLISYFYNVYEIRYENITNTVLQ